MAGWTVAKLLGQSYKDRLAIAIEAGIQNTGIAIFILRFALGQVRTFPLTPTTDQLLTSFVLL